MKKIILIATSNKGKFEEIKFLCHRFLKEKNIKLLSLQDFPKIDLPIENGSNYKENSLIKARYYSRKLNIDKNSFIICDDSGISIEILDNMPSIYSARFAMNDKLEEDYNFAFNKIKKMLIEKNIDIENDNIRAKFTSNISLYDNNRNKFINSEADVKGRISFPPKGGNGFGYDPIFILDNYNISFSEMKREEKLLKDHRFHAMKKIFDYINDISTN